MKQRRIMHVLGALFPVLISWKIWAADEVQVRIMPDVQYEVNGWAEVQPIFGGNVNGTSRGEAVELIRELNMSSARAFLWAISKYTTEKRKPPHRATSSHTPRA